MGSVLRRGDQLLTSRQVTACLLGIILFVAIRGVVWPYEVNDLLTADATYGIHMLEYPLLDFRPPPPNRLFPDVLLHAAVSPLGLDLLGQKIAVGVIVFLLTAWAVGYYKGLAVMAGYLAITTCAGFDFLNSCEHYSLPLTFLLFSVAKHRLVRALLLFIAVFCDLLFVLPLIAYYFERAEPWERPWIVAVSIVALAAAVLYAEFAPILAPFAGILPVAIAAGWWANRRGWTWPLCVATGLFLLVLAQMGYHARYSQPMLATMLLIYAPNVSRRFDWRMLATPAAIVALFFLTYQRSLHDRLDSQMRCLVDTLAGRGVANVAVDYWTARPLYFAARSKDVPMTVTVTDFNDSDPDPFMAPYEFYGSPTVWGIRNEYNCEYINSHPKVCGQDSVADVISREPVCGNFVIYHYATPIPSKFGTPPTSKWSSLKRNIRNYLDKGQELAADLVAM